MDEKYITTEPAESTEPRRAEQRKIFFFDYVERAHLNFFFFKGSAMR